VLCQKVQAFDWDGLDFSRRENNGGGPSREGSWPTWTEVVGDSEMGKGDDRPRVP
jgi:hypothetical protein